MTETTYTNWVEIKQSSLIHNFRQIRNLVPKKTGVMAVVKTNGYGHDLVIAARVFAEAGADYLGVTTIEEGIIIRNAGINKPVLVFSPILPEQIESALANNLELTVCDDLFLEMLSAYAVKMNTIAKAHVKIDTGMGRLGIYPFECAAFYARLMRLPNIDITGTYTHFSDAGVSDRSKTQTQIKQFSDVISKLKSSGMYTGMVHAANSAGLLNYPDAAFDMVRPGTILYGQYPSKFVKKSLDLQDTWKFKTRITAIRKIPSGKNIGYGSEYTTRRETVAAIIPVGYADGFTLIPESAARRKNSTVKNLASLLFKKDSSSFVLINGNKAPVIGRVSMQMCSIDITELRDVKTGDEVVVPARRTSVSGSILRVLV
ncbi:MAG: alanine racemase [Armatimonadota bacterium]